MECSFTLLLGHLGGRRWGIDHHFQHIRMKLPAIQHQDHTCSHQHEEPGVDEPRQRRHPEIVCAQTEVELIGRSEEHTSELQSRENLVCRLLLEKKKK